MNIQSNKNIVYVTDKNISYIQFKKLLEYPEVVHAYTVDKNVDFKIASNHSKDKNFDTAINNYKQLCSDLDLNFNNSIRADLDHTDKFKIVNKIEEANFNITDDKYDALITNYSNVNLITTSSDCIVFLIYDPIKKVIANVHSGWRGTYNKILETALYAMANYYGCKFRDIMIFICPSIRECHFEVDSSVFKIFKYRFGNYPDIIREKGNKWHIDTVLLNKYLATDLGVREDNIYDSEICTVCNSDTINSYRAHKEKFGQNAGIIGMKGKVKCLKKN